MNPIRAWLDMTDSEKSQIAWTLVMLLGVTVIVLYAIAASRGQDVDYFKARLGFMEQRLNYMDQKIDNTNQRQAEQRENLNEIRRVIEAEQRRSEENQRWIEHWKNLPQLPKPPTKR